jgi:hypothetical protein
MAACRSDGEIAKRVIELASTSTVVAQQYYSIFVTLNADVDVATDNTLRSLVCPTTSTGTAIRRTIKLSKSRRWHRFFERHKSSATDDC